MCHNYKCGAARLGLLDSVTQRLFPVGIEIGIRLIQQDQPAVAEERTRQTDTLALSAGKLVAVAAYFGLITVRQ